MEKNRPQQEGSLPHLGWGLSQDWEEDPFERSFPLSMRHAASSDPRLTRGPRTGTMTAVAELLPEAPPWARDPREIHTQGGCAKAP